MIRPQLSWLVTCANGVCVASVIKACKPQRVKPCMLLLTFFMRQLKKQPGRLQVDIHYRGHRYRIGMYAYKLRNSPTEEPNRDWKIFSVYNRRNKRLRLPKSLKAWDRRNVLKVGAYRILMALAKKWLKNAGLVIHKSRRPASGALTGHYASVYLTSQCVIRLHTGKIS